MHRARVVSQKSISAQICQLVIYIRNNKEKRFVGELTFTNTVCEIRSAARTGRVPLVSEKGPT